MRRHWFAAVLAMATLAACSSGAAESTAAAQPATAPLPSATPAAAPKPVGPPDFVIAGEFTQGGWVKGTAPAGTVALTLDGAQVPVAGDGSFFIAFDRDSGQSGLLVARLGDGKQVRRQLSIAPRAWKIEHVNVARRPLPSIAIAAP